MGVLDTYTVLDLAVLVQGPQAAATLHDMGASVIKVELPEIGDLGRVIPVSEDDSRSPYYKACNRGKRSVSLDLRTAGGKRALERLVAAADVLIHNFVPIRGRTDVRNTDRRQSTDHHDLRPGFGAHLLVAHRPQSRADPLGTSDHPNAAPHGRGSRRLDPHPQRHRARMAGLRRRARPAGPGRRRALPRADAQRWRPG